MYATVEDFILRVGEGQAIDLTDRERAGVVDTSVLMVALADSSSQIDAYLAGRYALPLTPIPLNIVRICCELARYHLCSMTDVTITEEIIARYKLCLKELEQLANGKNALGISQAASEESGEAAVLFSNGNTRIFSRDHKD